jgi:Cu(I)/Ag(I) efflux system membrane fusion protein
MNRSFGAEEHESTHRHTDATPLTDVEKEAIVKFIQAADAIARALAADDLARFNAVTPNIKSATESLTAALAHRSELAPLLGKLAPTGRLSTATDLPAARKTFHAFSTAATALASALHQLKGMPPFDVFECPMVDQGVPGAPKRGRWLQIAGREMANPFMGRRMAECGEKIELPKAP